MYERFTSIIQSKTCRYLVRCLVLAIAFALWPINVQAVEYDTRMFLLVNNSYSLCDYKLTSTEYDDVYNAIKRYDSEYRNLDKDESAVVKPKSYTRNLMDLSNNDVSKSDYAMVYENSKTYKSWLIKHNVLERPANVSSDGVSLASAPYLQDTVNANRAIFLSLLYKAKNGPIQSNIVYSTERMGHPGKYTRQTPVAAWGHASGQIIPDYWGKGLDANLVGDYVAYTTSNVWELYLTEMVDAGLISLDDFDKSFAPASEFVDGYTSKDSSSVPWKTDKVISRSGGALGYYFNVNAGGTLRVTPKGEPLYFRPAKAGSEESDGLTNELSVYEALKYIYKYMSQTESAMSDMESSIIAFKYGLSQFYNVPDKYKRYVYYAVAKGIIPYDDTENRFLLEGTLSNGQMYELIYRVANKGARYDFSEVTLTDTEQEFMNKGYTRSTLSVYSVLANPITSVACYKNASNAKNAECPDGEDTGVTTASSKDTGGEKSLLSAFLDPLTLKAQAAGTKKKNLNKYYVVRWFDCEYKSGNTFKPTENYYTFKTDSGKAYVFNTESKAGLPAALKQSGGSWSVKSEVYDKTANINKITCTKPNDVITSGGKEYKVMKLIFEVNATSKTSALQYVQGRIGFNCKNQVLLDGYSTVLKTATSQDTNVINTVISQAALKQLKDIAVIRDKVLVNKVTGVQALFVDDPNYNYALVGNTIFTQSDTISYTDGKEVYYNLNVILHLLSGSASCRDLGLNDYSSINNAILMSSSSIDSKAKVKYELDAGMNNNYAYYLHAGLNGNDKKKVSVSSKSSTFRTNNIFYDIDSIVTGVNSVCKTITVDYPSGDSTVPIDVTLVVDFAYMFPDFADSSVEDLDISKVKTYEGYQSLLYKCPKEGTTAAEWWSYNYNFNNALLNFLFETKDVVFCPTGYLVPHMTVLLPDYLTESSIDFDYENTDEGHKKAREDWCLSEPFTNGDANDTHGDTVCNTILNLATKDLLLGMDDNSIWWQSVFNGQAIEAIAADHGIAGKDELKSAVQNFYSFEAVYASRESKGMYVLYSDKNGVKCKKGTADADKYGATRYVQLTTGKLYRYTQTCNFWYNFVKGMYAPAIEAENTSSTKESMTFTVHTRTSQMCELDTEVIKGTKFAARTSVKCSDANPVDDTPYTPGSTTSGSGGTGESDKNYQMWHFTTLPKKLKDIYKKQVDKDTGVSLLEEYISAVPCFDVGNSFHGLFKSTIVHEDGKYYLAKYTQKSLGAAMIDEGVYSPATGILCDMNIGDDKSISDMVIDQDFTNKTAISINGHDVNCYDAQIINTAGNMQGISIKSNHTGSEPAYYYSAGKVYKATFEDSNTAFLQTCTKSECDALIDNETEVTVIPRIYVKPKTMNLVKAHNVSIKNPETCEISNCNHFHDTPTGMSYVFKGMYTSVSVLDQGFYQYSTVQRAIDSVMYKDASVSEISNFDTGYRLVIGDMKFVKNKGYWVSYPIKASKSHLNKLKIGKSFGTLQDLFKGMFVTAEGSLFPLSNYVDGKDVCLSSADDVRSLLKECHVTGNIMLGASDNFFSVYDKTCTDIRATVKMGSKSSVNNAKYFSIKFKFREKLYARPLNIDNNEWALMLCNDYIMGSNALSIYNMKLDYDLDDDISLTLLSNKFDFADNVEGARLSFEELYKDTKANSWFWYLRYTLVYYSMYLVFLVWITRIREVKNFFKLLYHEETGKIDLLALTTFGILDLKRDISYNRAMAITLLFAFFDAIIIYVL